MKDLIWTDDWGTEKHIPFIEVFEMEEGKATSGDHRR